MSGELEAAKARHLAAIDLIQAGEIDAGAAAATEAVELYGIAAAAHDADARAIADNLSSLAALLWNVAVRKEEAILAAKAAVDILRAALPAVEGTPGFWRAFAAALHDLASFLAATGRVDESIAPALEAVDAYRRAAATAGAEAIAIALQLRVVGRMLAGSGRMAEAAVAAQAAVDVLRADEASAAGTPGFRRAFADALHDLAAFLFPAGRPDDGTARALEAVTQYRAAAAAASGADLGGIALQLRSVAGKLATAGRRPEAVVAAEAALEVLRTPGAAGASGFRRSLADTLHDLLAHLLEAGRVADAAARALEAVEAYRSATAADDADARGIALQLRSVAGKMRSAGRKAEAVAAAQAAVDILRVLDAGATAHWSALAAALHDLAVALMEAEGAGDRALDLAPLVFAPFTEAGAFLPVAAAGGEDDPAPPLMFDLAIAERSGDRWQTLPAQEVDARLQLRLIEGNLGRLLFALGAEKPRLRRAAREIAAARRLEDASGAWLDRHGDDLGVPRLSGRPAWRQAGGGSIAIEPGPPEADTRYRVRLRLYRARVRRSAGALERAVNGTAAAPGPLAAFGYTGSLRVAEVAERPPAAIVLVPPGPDPARQNLITALRRDVLVCPEASADAVHAGRPLSPGQRDAEAALRAGLRASWRTPQGAAFAPRLAAALVRAGALLAALGVPADARVVQRAQDSGGGSRFELGLGAEILPLAAARWDGVVAALGAAPPALPGPLAALLPALRRAARPAAKDPDGTWFWHTCGFASVVARLDALYLSHLNDGGLVVTAMPSGASFDLAAEHAPPRPPVPGRRLQWSALPIAAAPHPPVLTVAGGGAHIRVAGLTAVIVADTTQREGTGPYTYEVLPTAEHLLNLEQYELLLNLLEAGNPVGVEIGTATLRQRFVDADGDGDAEPLTMRAANSFRRWRRSAVRSRDKAPDPFTD